MKSTKQKPIAQHLQEWLDADQEISGPRSALYGRDVNRIMGVINGTLDNFVIFNNAGGRLFHIWSLEHELKNAPIEEFEKFVNRQMKYAYMYKINGKETIVRELPIYREQTFEEAYPELYKDKNK